MASDEELNVLRTEVRASIEKAIEDVFARLPETAVSQAAKYAVLNGGQRWRGVLMAAAGRIFDDRAEQICLPSACGAEFAHAASLVLDDLPSMDNARLRRGRPCVHCVFPAWAVDMVPAFLIALAYAVSLDNPRVSYEARVIAALDLGRAGLRMTHGQALDLTDLDHTPSVDRLLECYRLKTGTLCASAAKVGAIECGAPSGDADLLETCGMHLGVAYQLLDDLADRTASLEEMGKCPGMDAAKRTAVDLFGVDGVKRKVAEFKQEALRQLEQFGARAGLLRELITQTGYASLL